MRFVMLYHSLVSDWNHGNAHFLRGVASELLSRGHDVSVYEPRDGWSYTNLVATQGLDPVRQFEARYPQLRSHLYDPINPNLDEMFDQADVVMVHEWNPPDLIAKVGEHRKRYGSYRLFFHDTHHRAVSSPDTMGLEALAHYDGVLVFGESLREMYAAQGWSSRVHVWHEAADTRIFHPCPNTQKAGDLVWIGNWGDGERTAELEEFLVNPSKALGLKTRVHGVRYPWSALAMLRSAGIEYGGWVPNYCVPSVFARYRMTVHIPRSPYRQQLSGIPTIRVFEALACGIPLICAPWDDREGLFEEGEDYLLANSGAEMQEMMSEVLGNEALRTSLIHHGIETIRSRHTCAHRVTELLEIVNG